MPTPRKPSRTPKTGQGAKADKRPFKVEAAIHRLRDSVAPYPEGSPVNDCELTDSADNNPAVPVTDAPTAQDAGRFLARLWDQVGATGRPLLTVRAALDRLREEFGGR